MVNELVGIDLEKMRPKSLIDLISYNQLGKKKNRPKANQIARFLVQSNYNWLTLKTNNNWLLAIHYSVDQCVGYPITL